MTILNILIEYLNCLQKNTKVTSFENDVSIIEKTNSAQCCYLLWKHKILLESFRQVYIRVGEGVNG